MNAPGTFLSYSHLEISLSSVVWIYCTFENYFEFKQRFTKCLKESNGWGFDQQ